MLPRGFGASTPTPLRPLARKLSNHRRWHRRHSPHYHLRITTSVVERTRRRRYALPEIRCQRTPVYHRRSVCQKTRHAFAVALMYAHAPDRICATCRSWGVRKWPVPGFAQRSPSCGRTQHGGQLLWAQPLLVRGVRRRSRPLTDAPAITAVAADDGAALLPRVIGPPGWATVRGCPVSMVTLFGEGRPERAAHRIAAGVGRN
jgi:hypothetical protein